MLINKTIFPFAITALMLKSSLFAQEDEKKFSDTFGFEAGAGYNTAVWKFTDIGPPNFKINTIANRNAFWIQPAVRLFYSFTLHAFSENKKIKLPVFTGYYTFGGSAINISAIPEDPISKEIYLFRSIEAGINPCLEKNHFQLGLLFKGQYIFSVKHRTYHDPFWNNGVSMEERDITEDYKSYAMNTGVKIKYKINKFSIGTEAWFGITNLYAHKTYGNNGKLKVMENNYRLLLGYVF